MANKLEEFKGLDELLSFLTRFLASPDYVKNPYLRAKIVRHHTHSHTAIGGGIHAALAQVEVVLALTPKQAGRNLGIFETNKLASTHLAGALMAFYVDIEFTGRTCTPSFSLPIIVFHIPFLLLSLVICYY